MFLPNRILVVIIIRKQEKIVADESVLVCIFALSEFYLLKMTSSPYEIVSQLHSNVFVLYFNFSVEHIFVLVVPFD